MNEIGRKFGWIIGGVILMTGVWFIGWGQFSGEDKTEVLVVLPTETNPFWQEVHLGAEEVGATLGDSGINVTVRTGTEDTDASAQIATMKRHLGAGEVDALVLGPASSHAVVPTVASYRESGVPVTIIDSRLDSVSLADHGVTTQAFIGSDNVEGGRKAAQRMERFLGSEVDKILLIEGSPAHSTAIARSEGFQDGMPDEWKRTLVTKTANWRKSEANRVTRSVIASGVPDGIFASSDQMAMGALAALESAGISNDNWPVIIGFDATVDGLRAIENGCMVASIRQQAKKVGRLGVETAKDLGRGGQIEEKDILVPTEIVPPITDSLPRSDYAAECPRAQE